MPALAIRFEARSMSSSPARVIEPLRWPTMPMIARRVVVLPAPLRPSKVTTSPSPTEKFMPCRLRVAPSHGCRSPTRSNSLGRTAVSGMTGPHIGLDHLRVFRHCRIIALGKDAAASEHGDRVGEIGDDREIVLHHQHSAVGGNLADPRRDAGHVLVAQPRHRLVAQAPARRDGAGAGGAWREEVGQQVEHGSLAGAVGADQRMDGAAPYFERDLAHGGEAAKLLRQTLGSQDYFGHVRHPVSAPDAWPRAVKSFAAN